MVFIETPVFERDRAEYFTDEVFAKLEQALADDPEAGNIIPHGKGLRKIRWALPGRGKRGGARVIYYWRTAESQILFVAMYAKNEQMNLTPKQLKVLAAVVTQELK